MLHVVLSQTGPEWDGSKPMEGQSYWDEHAAFVDDLVERGFVVLGGPVGDERRMAHAVEASSSDDIRATLARDRGSQPHLVIESIDPWTIKSTAGSEAHHAASTRVTRESSSRSALLRSVSGDTVARRQSRESVAALECRRSTRVLCQVRLRRRLEAGDCPFDSALVEEIRKCVGKGRVEGL